MGSRGEPNKLWDKCQEHNRNYGRSRHSRGDRGRHLIEDCNGAVERNRTVVGAMGRPW
jgi:hypothetical protein